MKHLKRLGIVCLVVLALIFFPITIMVGIIAGIVAFFRGEPKVRQTLNDMIAERQESRNCKSFLQQISKRHFQEQIRDLPRDPCVQKTDNRYHQSYRRETFTLFQYKERSPKQKSAEYYRVREIKNGNSPDLNPAPISRKTAFLRKFLCQPPM